MYNLDQEFLLRIFPSNFFQAAINNNGYTSLIECEGKADENFEKLISMCPGGDTTSTTNIFFDWTEAMINKVPIKGQGQYKYKEGEDGEGDAKFLFCIRFHCSFFWTTQGKDYNKEGTSNKKDE